MDIEKFILEWNRRYPFDRYIRKKYNILFGSSEHRAMNFVDMAIEFKEDIIIKHQEEEQERLKERDWYNEGLPATKQIGVNKEGQKVVKMTKKELDKEFEDLDLSKFNDVNSGGQST
jgi:hypothetical protein